MECFISEFCFYATLQVKHFVASKEDRERFADLIPKDKLKEMIKRENELRVSDEYQEMYRREAELPGHVWMDVSDVIQSALISLLRGKVTWQRAENRFFFIF